MVGWVRRNKKPIRARMGFVSAYVIVLLRGQNEPIPAANKAQELNWKVRNNLVL